MTTTTTQCTQPGCGGTIEDGYCAVCGMAAAPAPVPVTAADHERGSFPASAGTGGSMRVAFAPDGRTLAVAADRGAAVYDVVDSGVLGARAVQGNPILAAAAGPAALFTAASANLARVGFNANATNDLPTSSVG